VTGAPQLQTARLLLRGWTPGDEKPFAELCGDPEVMQHFPATLSRRESNALMARLQEHFARHGFGLWAVELPGMAPFIGFVGLSHVPFTAHFTPAVEVGWRLARSFWGRGYASEAAAAVVGFGFARLGLKQIVSFTVPANVRSRRVMERLGMTCDTADDFDHPGLPEGHPLRPHVLYRLTSSDWSAGA
jgi:RimJ/RimL family protein N-acetyltransferase